MKDPVRIELQPLARSFEVERGTPLQDVLFPYGVEFPCGGRGRCRRCRVKVLAGQLPVTPEQETLLSPGELAAGWRLGCHSFAVGDLTLEIAQWETAILADNSSFEFTPREGLGIAIDLGTTTLVAQLLDLSSGHVLAVRTALNPQAAYGADVMSRVELATTPDGRLRLQRSIRHGLGGLIHKLMTAERRSPSEIAIVGNTVMHHLFCGIDIEPLSHAPFEPVRDGLEVFHPEELAWDLPGNTVVRFLPCLGGFVGSDVLAGVIATKMHESESLIGLIDLGTNGEIVIGNRERMICASTAAGPAFEGGRIKMGMRASTGAIAEVMVRGGRMSCHVLGNTAPRGICGSGLVDAVAAGLDLDWIRPTGRLSVKNGSMTIQEPVVLTQSDIRELQMAKGAIAAGVQILLRQWGADMEDIARFYLAGAFGNYINRASARRIGLLEIALEKVEPAGNTALLGTKLALFGDIDFDAIRRRIEHISLAADPQFQEVYVDSMTFPTGIHQPAAVPQSSGTAPPPR